MTQILITAFPPHMKAVDKPSTVSSLRVATPSSHTEKCPLFPFCTVLKTMNMNCLRLCKGKFQLSSIPTHFNRPKTITKGPASINPARKRRKPWAIACTGGEKKSERRSFLSVEEAGLVEVSGLSSHERFLCRLTISSLNLLKVIAEQEECAIEELNAGRVCDWFLKDKLKREQNLESAVLQWDDDSQFEF